MSLPRMDHVGIVVEDLDAAVEFFSAIGLEREGGTTVEGEMVDRVIGLEGARSDVVMMGTPGGGTKLELTRFHSPPAAAGEPDAPSNALGLRHVIFEVEDLRGTVARLEGLGATLVGEIVDYGDSYTLCYLRGPAGVIVELAEKLGR
jgi:catechol 2,3-dioxygenase-like lactoylglutathione lyase family enzyme